MRTMPETAQDRADQSILLAFAPLRKTAFGVAAGVVCGSVVFAATLTLRLRGITDSDFNLLSQYFKGFSVSFGGAFIGLAWGFALGFALGWGFALLRNFAFWLWLTVIRSEAEMDQYSDFLDHM
jgi:hypothetical protein